MQSQNRRLQTVEEEEVLCFLFVYLVADGMFGTFIIDTRPIAP